MRWLIVALIMVLFFTSVAVAHEDTDEAATGEFAGRAMARPLTTHIPSSERMQALRGKALENIGQTAAAAEQLEAHQLRKLGRLGRAEREQVFNLTEEQVKKVAALGQRAIRELLQKPAGVLRSQLERFTLKEKTRREHLKSRELGAREKKAIADTLTDLRRAVSTERTAGLAVAVRARELKGNYTACANSTAANCTGIRMQMINHTKTALLHHVNSLSAHLDRLAQQITEREILPATTVEVLLGNITQSHQQLREIAAAISNADTAAELKSQAAKLRAFWKKNQPAVDLHGVRVLRAKAQEIIRQGEILEQRMERVLDFLDERNVSMEGLEANITLFSQQLDAARMKYNESQAVFRGVMTVQEARRLAQEAHRLLADAQLTLKAVMAAAHEKLEEAQVTVAPERLDDAEERIPEIGEEETIVLAIGDEEDSA